MSHLCVKCLISVTYIWLMETTQLLITEAAIHVLNRDPSASVDFVAGCAGVTRRTFYRYFKDKQELLEHCELEMQKSCREAATQAINSSELPQEQLENWLYAAIDCGRRYLMFQKIHERPGHVHDEGETSCAEYNRSSRRFKDMITNLQANELVSHKLTADWIFAFFSGIINTAINTTETGVGLK
jgi:AcrR family transcriptional regulator